MTILLHCRYNVEEEAGCDDLDQGDNGWKIIHTDVFRFPPYKSLLCAVLGVGAQFLTLATGKVLLGLTWLAIFFKFQTNSRACPRWVCLV